MTCGGGTRSRSYVVLTPASNGGASCPTTQQQVCGVENCNLVTPTPTPTPIPNPTPAESPDDPVLATMSLGISIDTIGAVGSSSYSEFENNFVTELSAALGVPDSRIEVLNVAAGSVVVTFRILPPSGDSTASPSQLFNSLSNMLTNQSSAIYTGGHALSTADSSTGIVQLSGDNTEYNKLPGGATTSQSTKSSPANSRTVNAIGVVSALIWCAI